jgi:protein O-GlcNAc transferase
MLGRSQSFQQAVDLHRRGQLAAAEAVYVRLLRGQSDDFDVLHCLGILRYRSAFFDRGRPAAQSALSSAPTGSGR